jgi:hypothetical protein
MNDVSDFAYPNCKSRYKLVRVLGTRTFGATCYRNIARRKTRAANRLIWQAVVFSAGGDGPFEGRQSDFDATRPSPDAGARGYAPDPTN